MIRSTARALAPALLLLVGTCGPAPAVAQAVSGRVALVPARQACDADGRCYETGDPGDRDDDAPPPRRRFDPDDDDRPPPPRHRRYEPNDDEPPPPRHHYHRDDDEN